MLLENKNAAVYGAGGAVGGAVARAFAREGCPAAGGDPQGPRHDRGSRQCLTGGARSFARSRGQDPALSTFPPAGDTAYHTAPKEFTPSPLICPGLLSPAK
jgi:NAD(P)-dependent dehydrogenase (short-subunit alcohol dehydrogenase family)